jgi:hypothetical protein
MLSPSDFCNLIALGQDRQAEMLARARQQRLLKEAPPAHSQAHRVWQWLHHAVIERMQHVHLFEQTAKRHSVPHH